MNRNNDDEFDTSYSIGPVSALVLVWFLTGIGFIVWLFVSLFGSE